MKLKRKKLRKAKVGSVLVHEKGYGMAVKVDPDIWFHFDRYGVIFLSSKEMASGPNEWLRVDAARTWLDHDSAWWGGPEDRP